MTTGTNNLTDLIQSDKMMNAVGYTVIALIMTAQAVSAVNILAGQLLYLSCNILALWRCFTLNRPMADKVKDVACLGLTASILIVKFF